MRLKGYHKDKKHIMYKAEGDGFQADALCQEIFTYHISMRNDPAPTNTGIKVYTLFIQE